MKYLLIFAVVLSLSSISAYSYCSYCTIPDDWTCINDGGQKLYNEQGRCYRGFIVVDIHPQDKSVTCYGEGYRKCEVPSEYWSSSLQNALIDKALDEMYNNNINSGSVSINMYIDGTPRYGSVIWNKNTTTNESTINTTVN